MSIETPQSPEPNSILRSARHLSSMHFSVFTEKYYELRENRPKDQHGKLRKQWIRLTRNYIKTNRGNFLINYIEAKQIHNSRRSILQKLFFNKWKSIYNSLKEEEDKNVILEEEEEQNVIMEEEEEQNQNEDIHSSVEPEAIIESSGMEFRLEANSRSFSTENDELYDQIIEEQQTVTKEEEINDGEAVIKEEQIISTDEVIDGGDVIEEEQIITKDQIIKQGEIIEDDQIITKEQIIEENVEEEEITEEEQKVEDEIIEDEQKAEEDEIIEDKQKVEEEEIIEEEQKAEEEEEEAVNLEELSPRSKAIRIKQLADKATDVIQIPPQSLSERINWKKLLITLIILIFAGILTYAGFQYYFDKNNFGKLYKKHKYEKTLPPYDQQSDVDVVIDYNDILTNEQEDLSHLVKSLSKEAKNIKNRQIETNDELNKIQESLDSKKVEVNQQIDPKPEEGEVASQ